MRTSKQGVGGKPSGARDVQNDVQDENRRLKKRVAELETTGPNAELSRKLARYEKRIATLVSGRAATTTTATNTAATAPPTTGAANLQQQLNDREDTIKTLTQRVQIAEYSLKLAEDDRDKHIRSLATSTADRLSFMRQISDLKKQVKTGTATSTTPGTAALTAQIKGLESQLAAATIKRDAAVSARDIAILERDAARKDIKTVYSDDCQTKIDELDTKIADLKKSRDKYKKDRDDERDRRRRRQEEREALATQLDDMVKQLAECKKGKKQSDGEKKLQGEIDRLTKELAKAKKQNEKDKNLKDDVKRLTKELADAEKQLALIGSSDNENNLQAQVDRLTKDLADANSKATLNDLAASGDKRKSRQEIDRLNNELADAKAKLAAKGAPDSSANEKKLQDDVDRLTKELADAKKQLAAKGTSGSRSEINRLQNDLQALQARHTTVSDQAWERSIELRTHTEWKETLYPNRIKDYHAIWWGVEDWVASIYLAGGSKPGDIYLQYMKSNPATLQKLKNFVNQNKDIYPDKYPFEDFGLFVGIINRFLEQRVFNGIDRLYTHLEQVVRAMNMVEATMMTEKRTPHQRQIWRGLMFHRIFSSPQFQNVRKDRTNELAIEISRLLGFPGAYANPPQIPRRLVDDFLGGAIRLAEHFAASQWMWRVWSATPQAVEAAIKNCKTDAELTAALAKYNLVNHSANVQRFYWEDLAEQMGLPGKPTRAEIQSNIEVLASVSPELFLYTADKDGDFVEYVKGPDPRARLPKDVPGAQNLAVSWVPNGASRVAQMAEQDTSGLAISIIPPKTSV